MIAIKNIDDRCAEAICDRLSLPRCDVLQMCDGERLLGTCCVHKDGKEATVHYLDAPDAALTDALLRAALNFAMANGAVSAHVVPETLRNDMLKKGYFTESTDSVIKIADFFAKRCCNG